MTDADLLALEANDLDRPDVIRSFGEAACRTHSVADAEVARRKLTAARKLRRWLMIYCMIAVNEIEKCQEAWAAEAAQG